MTPLRFAGLGLLGAALATASPAAAQSQSPSVSVTSHLLVSTTAFRGESCSACHTLFRDHRPTALHPGTEPRDAGTFDAVVVGGGAAGLSAAYALRDYKVLLLEKEGKAGGKIRRDSLGGRLFPAGGVYMGEPTGRLKDMFRSLGLKAERVTMPDHSLSKDGGAVDSWITGDPSRLFDSSLARSRFRAFQEYLVQMAHSGKLAIPFQASDPKTVQDLDQYSFYQWADNNFGSDTAQLADLYARDVFGTGAETVSATVGVLFMASETEPAYTWTGGLGAVSEALEGALGPRISTGAVVWKVSQDLDEAVVDYQDGTSDYRAKAKAVILAVPSMVVRKIMTGLTDGKIEALANVRYSSYMIVPLKLNRIVWKGSLVLWTPGKFFTDLTLPVASPEALQGSDNEILVASIPMGESEGRRKMLYASDSEFTSKVLIDLDSVFKGAAFSVDEARVIRWGHAMPIPYPGYLSKVRPVLAKSEGRFFFAGVDTEVPAIEGAIESGLRAASEVQHFLKTRQ